MQTQKKQSTPGQQRIVLRRLSSTGRRIYAAGPRAPYDSEALHILKDKQYLARILKECTTEFASMELTQIIPCIDEPSVGNLPVEPGLTNLTISGDATESKIPHEGTLTYDIRFTATVPETETLRAAVQHAPVVAARPAKKYPQKILMRIDVEVQQDESPGYDLVSRGMLYGGRMLSEQMGQNVNGHDYDRLQKVYSIWICVSTPLARANTISRYAIKHTAVYGKLKDLARSDLLQVIMIRLPNEDRKRAPKNPPTELMQLLSATFSKKMPMEEKLQKISALGVRVSDDMKGHVNVMCNLSQGIFEDGRRKGKREGWRDGVQQGIRIGQESQIKRMLEQGRTPDAISDFCGYSLEEVQKVQAELQKESSVTV